MFSQLCQVRKKIPAIRKGTQQESHSILSNATGSQDMLQRMKPTESLCRIVSEIWTHYPCHKQQLYGTTDQLVASAKSRFWHRKMGSEVV